MNAPFATRDEITIPIEFQSCFDSQRAAYFAKPEPSYGERLVNLQSLQRLLKDNRGTLVAAINAGYGNLGIRDPVRRILHGARNNLRIAS